MDKDLNLNDSAPLPEGDNGLGDATGSLGDLSKADVRQGFSTMSVPKGDIVGAGEEEMDEFLSIFDDEPKFGGFAGRPEGWER